MIKHILLIIIILFIVSCSDSKYKTISYENFTIDVPKDWKKIKLKGIDSDIGGLLTSKKDTLIYDYGKYSWNLINDDIIIENTNYDSIIKSLDQSIFIEIDCYKTKLFKPNKHNNYLIGIYIDSLKDGGSFNMYGYNLDKIEQQKFLKAIKTIRFKK